MGPSRGRAAAALRAASGTLSTTATTQMASEMRWFSSLSAQERSWVGLIVQAGVQGFVDWFDHPTDPAFDQGATTPALATAVFGAAPRELTGVITLQQTVDLIRLSIDVVERSIDSILDPADVDEVRSAVLRYSREVAFATAEVYARAAESRGAWDARLEALVVDAVVRAETDEALLSRASALGWGARGDVAVVLGATPSRRTESDVFDDLRRTARAADLDALCATQGDRLVVLLGGVVDAHDAAEQVVDFFGPGPVVVGPIADDLAHAHASARAALSAHRAAGGWPDAPRPVLSSELLPERTLAGDGHARRHLVEQAYLPLLATGEVLVTTVTAYFEHGSSIEATARSLFVHPNTVRYRLRQVAEVIGLSPTRQRDALALQMALILGRQSGRTSRP